MQMLKRRMICGVVSALFVSAFLLVALQPSMARAELNPANSSSENDQIGSSSELQTQADEGPRWEAYGVYGGKFAYMVDWASKTDGDDLYTEFNSKIVRSDGTVTIDLPIGGEYKEVFPHPDFVSGADTGIVDDMAHGALCLKSSATGLWGAKTLDGEELIPFKYDFIVPAGRGTAPFVASWDNGSRAGIDYLDYDGSVITSVGKNYTGNSTGTYLRYGNEGYPYDVLYINGTGTKLIVEKQGQSYVERTDIDQAPARENSSYNSGANDSSDADGFWNKESYTLEDGTAVRYSHEVQKTESGAYRGVISVVGDDGNPIVMNGYTLGICRSEFQQSLSAGSAQYAVLANSLRNSVKHGNADVWWATDGSGKWGAVNSAGEVVVPFKYEAYADRGLDDTDYALVKENGSWKFLKVAGETGASTQSMHRLYNPNSGEHFYTADDVERDGLVELGWNSEGEGWTAPETSDTPVYRMYNPVAGEHHYTPDVEERDMLIGAGWNDEGIGWYSDDAKTVPLYRDYNPNAFANNHNYTVDREEHEWLLSLGWRDEGYAWYGM